MQIDRVLSYGYKNLFWKMVLVIKVIWCSVFLIYFEVIQADYANSTINAAKTISDDFRKFQQTGKRISRREGRGLFTFDTLNDDLKVGFFLFTKIENFNRALRYSSLQRSH